MFPAYSSSRNETAMGIHVSVCDRQGRDIPAWDWERMAGDRELVNLVYASDTIEVEAAGGYRLCRPASTEAMRLQIDGWPNPDRLKLLCDMLDENPDYWINFGL
jgi:hypothetical protein